MAHYPDWPTNDHYDSQNEGLAAKLESVNKTSSLKRGVKRKADIDFDGVDTSDGETEEEETNNAHQGANNGSSLGRRVRARSLIDDEQLAVLKGYYAINQRPKKEEIVTIANYINFPTRVVQVWFQNSRARDRRESKIPALVPICVSNYQTINEQPLDLSKKEAFSVKKESEPMGRNSAPKENSHNAVGPRTGPFETDDLDDSPLVIDEETCVDNANDNRLGKLSVKVCI